MPCLLHSMWDTSENQQVGMAPHLPIRTITGLMISWMTPALMDYINKKTSPPVVSKPPNQQKQEGVVVRDSFGARYNLPVRLVQETTVVQKGAGHQAHKQHEMSNLGANIKPQVPEVTRGRLASADCPAVNQSEQSAPKWHANPADAETSKAVTSPADRSTDSRVISDRGNPHDRMGTPEKEQLKSEWQTTMKQDSKVQEEWLRLQQDRSAFEYDKQYEREKLSALQHQVQRDRQKLADSRQLQQDLEHKKHLLAQEKDIMATDKHQLEIQWRQLAKHKQDLAADREDVETEKEQLRREWLLLSEEQNFRQDSSKRKYLHFIRLKHLRMFKL
ncbi:uncharacterized protein LOC118415781 [Branchiostoma floridae]|uniref:Uncharacterized protein LOC118415781 n=1 Tax=Branchiostoma floridae TaxID=7739 RepID=A0A9J7L542_BRAFL|nr:uncharacterized protein LOC118415781 [Branchiostoma floridae]XP_035676502.1 uncharacterized protein LOC118415781 [Branchiostoma floridae]XP_035676511.1 uncharacterized protein LOC118415781 [Branchiostoma floridae]